MVHRVHPDVRQRLCCVMSRGLHERSVFGNSDDPEGHSPATYENNQLIAFRHAYTASRISIYSNGSDLAVHVHHQFHIPASLLVFHQ